MYQTGGDYSRRATGFLRTLYRMYFHTYVMQSGSLVSNIVSESHFLTREFVAVYKLNFQKPKFLALRFFFTLYFRFVLYYFRAGQEDIRTVKCLILSVQGLFAPLCITNVQYNLVAAVLFNGVKIKTFY